jgi:hypothetical protein
MNLKRKTPMKAGTKGLKRTAFKTAAPVGLKQRTPMKAASKPMAAVGARAKRTRQGKVAPNAEERAWLDFVGSCGCIVCRQQYGVTTPAEVHHLKEGGLRMGHLFSIPLCVPHHRGGAGTGPFISRHPWKPRFEAAYGMELKLLQDVQELYKNANSVV